MEMLQFQCAYCGQKWFGLKKYKGLEVTCPGCRQSFKALITSEPPPPPMSHQEKKEINWKKVGGAFWEVTKEILFIIMVLVLIVPMAIIYVGCLAFGGGRR